MIPEKGDLVSARKTTKNGKHGKHAKDSGKAKNGRRMVTAIAVAAGLLLAGGAGYRILAGYLARPTDSVPMSSEELNRLPLQIGPWVGKDVPMDKALVRATKSDALINRTYSRGGVGRAVGLFVAYGVRARDLMPHRPEVCYPGTGHTMQSNEPREVELADGTKLPCKLYMFTRAGQMGDHLTTVLNYYVIDGRYAPDVSTLRSQAWRGSGGVRYVAQVQIVCSGPATADLASSEQTVREFAAEAAPAIRALFPQAPTPATTATETTGIPGS